jgi:hypothetical protein
MVYSVFDQEKNEKWTLPYFLNSRKLELAEKEFDLPCSRMNQAPSSSIPDSNTVSGISDTLSRS